MILIDTGPCVALFDPKDSQHERCRRTLQTIKEPLFSTLPVLTETFHMLSPETHGSDRFRDFVLQGGLSVWFMDSTALQRAFELYPRIRMQLLEELAREVSRAYNLCCATRMVGMRRRTTSL